MSETVDDVRVALGTEILKELDDLRDMDPGSEEQQRAVSNIEKLYKLRIDEIRCDTDFDEKWNRRKMDEEEKKNQMEERKLDRIIRYALDGLAILAPLTFYGVWMRRGLKFEEEGTFTSTTFRTLFNKFRPTK